MAKGNKSIVRTYRGKQSVAQRSFLKDAEKQEAQGYLPVSEKWEPGSYGCMGFLVALLLCFILIGFLVFVYMILVKPPGTLTVTYEYQPEQLKTVVEEKTCPQCAENVKAAALVCRFCGYDFAS